MLLQNHLKDCCEFLGQLNSIYSKKPQIVSLSETGRGKALTDAEMDTFRKIWAVLEEQLNDIGCYLYQLTMSEVDDFL